MMTADELRRQSEAIAWWHGGMDLGQGVVTVSRWGNDPATSTLPRISLPDDMSGMTVLDIGAWDGFYSFECERRGGRVWATDSVAWMPQPFSPTGMAGFALARKALGSRVYAQNVDVMDLSPDDQGVFDIVLFLGVLYHLRHPLFGLERAAAMLDVGGLLIVESHVDLLGVGAPAMRFYPGAEINSDPTNWWGPNPECIEEMLKSVGLTGVRMVSGAGANRVCFHARRMS